MESSPCHLAVTNSTFPFPLLILSLDYSFFPILNFASFYLRSTVFISLLSPESEYREAVILPFVSPFPSISFFFPASFPFFPGVVVIKTFPPPLCFCGRIKKEFPFPPFFPQTPPLPPLLHRTWPRHRRFVLFFSPRRSG